MQDGHNQARQRLLRTLAIECAQSAVREAVDRKSKAPKARREGMDAKTVGHADKGTERIQRRFLHMVKAGKAVCACARELCCFVGTGDEGLRPFLPRVIAGPDAEGGTGRKDMRLARDGELSSRFGRPSAIKLSRAVIVTIRGRGHRQDH